MITESKPGPGQILNQAWLIDFGEEKITIGFPQGSFFLDRARDDTSRKEMEAALSAHLARSIHLEVQPLEDMSLAVPPLAQMEEDEEVLAQEKLRNEALEHPAVKNALRTLGGEVREVRALGARKERK
ncbi:hypothetical protein KAI87_15250 [Myxococcota bacterium]|nr:hypothetical protein [Myxococcota bacterium]